MRLNRYLMAELLRAWLLVGLVLVGLISLLVLLEELEDVGDGSYRLLDALWVVAAGTPSRLVGMLPFIALLGTLYAYADLARRSETVALAAAGVTRLRMALVAACTALMVSLVALPVDEYFAAPLYRQALLERLQLTGGGENLFDAGGFWSRQGDVFANIGAFSADGDASAVRVFTFGSGNVLQEVLWAAALVPIGQGFELANVQRRRYDAGGVHDSFHARLPGSGVPREVLVNAALPLSALRLSELAAQIRALQGLGQRADRHAGILWRRLLTPASAVTLALLAVPFTFGLIRGGGFALRLGIGAGVGLTWYIAEQIMFNAGLLAGLPPMAVALAPTALASAVALVLLARR